MKHNSVMTFVKVHVTRYDDSACMKLKRGKAVCVLQEQGNVQRHCFETAYILLYYLQLFKLDLKCPFSGQRTCYSPITISLSNIKSLFSRNRLLPCCDTGHCRKSFLYDITNHNCYISNYCSRPLRSVIVFSYPCKRLMCSLLYPYHCRRILGKRLP